MPRKAAPRASTQTLLPLDDVIGDVVRLRGGDFRAIVEAIPVNYALKAAEEQEAILAGYRRWLNGLSYPVQILVRVVPTDVDRYLDGFVDDRRRRHGELWDRLALDHESFVRRIARERTLLDRHCYVIIPAGTPGAPGRRRRWFGRHRPDVEHTPLIAARRLLAFRTAEVLQALAAIGVTAHRLDRDELVALWQASLAGVPLSGRAVRFEDSPVLTSAPGVPRPAREAGDD